MTEKRFQWIYIKNNTLELRDNGIVKVFNNERLEELLNDLAEENEQLKKLIHIADMLIGWNTIPQVRREWEKQKKVMWND